MLILVIIDGDSEYNKVRIIKIIKKIITDTRPENTRKKKDKREITIILKQNSYAGARRMRNETIFLRALKRKNLDRDRRERKKV